MALSQAGAGADSFTIAEAARRLGIAPDALMVRLFRLRFIYRFTGIGRPLAYARWVRAGLFVNTASEVRITQRGLNRVAGAPPTP